MKEILALIGALFLFFEGVAYAIRWGAEKNARNETVVAASIVAWSFVGLMAGGALVGALVSLVRRL